MAYEAHPAPWAFEPVLRDPRIPWAEWRSCNVIRDASGDPIMGDEDYYPWVDLNPEEWRMVAASPELLEVVRGFLAATTQAEFTACILKGEHVVSKIIGEPVAG